MSEVSSNNASSGGGGSKTRKPSPLRAVMPLQVNSLN